MAKYNFDESEKKVVGEINSVLANPTSVTIRNFKKAREIFEEAKQGVSGTGYIDDLGKESKTVEEFAAAVLLTNDEFAKQIFGTKSIGVNKAVVVNSGEYSLYKSGLNMLYIAKDEQEANSYFNRNRDLSVEYGEEEKESFRQESLCKEVFSGDIYDCAITAISSLIKNNGKNFIANTKSKNPNNIKDYYDIVNKIKSISSTLAKANDKIHPTNIKEQDRKNLEKSLTLLKQLKDEISPIQIYLDQTIKESNNKDIIEGRETKLGNGRTYAEKIKILDNLEKKLQSNQSPEGKAKYKKFQTVGKKDILAAIEEEKKEKEIELKEILDKANNINPGVPYGEYFSNLINRVSRVNNFALTGSYDDGSVAEDGIYYYYDGELTEIRPIDVAEDCFTEVFECAECGITVKYTEESSKKEVKEAVKDAGYCEC